MSRKVNFKFITEQATFNDWHLSEIKLAFMTRGIILFCFLFILFSCEKNTVNNCTEDKYEYALIKSAKIDTATGITPSQNFFYYQVNSGNNLVFQYRHDGPDCNYIADEEFTEYLVFQVPASSSGFHFQNTQLENAMCYYRRICFCDTRTQPVISGSIKGNKISENRWHIEINIDLPGTPDKLIFNKTFVTP